MCQWQSFLCRALASSQFFAIIMHQSAASPWGPPLGTLGDLSKCPFKPHQIPLRNSDKSPAPWMQRMNFTRKN